MKECNHIWQDDMYFAKDLIKLVFGNIGDVNEEMRQICIVCGKVRYIPKSRLNLPAKPEKRTK